MPDPLVRSIWIDAPPATVFRYFTDAEKHAKWSGLAARIEAQPGGIYELDMGSAGVISGRFLVVEPNFIRQEIDGPDGGPPSHIDIHLVDEADGTRLVVEHSGLMPPFDAIAGRGWDHHLARLSVACCGGNPGRDTLCEKPMTDLLDGSG